MYATFNTIPGPASESPDDLPPPRPRQKRSQVTRACDWCRVHRIKCDNNQPCLNCQSRGARCSNEGASEFRTLPHAFREIERLRRRNQELERELKEERTRNRRNQAAPVIESDAQLPIPPSVQPLSAPIFSDHIAENEASRRKYGEGIYTSTARSPAKTWYGPASLLYFISRLNAFLASTLQHHLPEGSMHLNSASRLLDGPISPPKQSTDGRDHIPPDDTFKGKEYLTPTQEEYFLDFYWQTHHTSLLVINESDFRQHYKSLWTGSRKSRKPSALVDIVIALCMQYGMAQRRGNPFPSWGSADVDFNDATLAGRLHYCRCQTLLASELESPTISTLQCNALSVIWLCCASFQNMADSTLALTARTAQMLGLHLPPPQDLPQHEREMRRRLWWSIYVLETKTSMKLGRPFVLHASHETCSLPGDGYEVAAMSGSNFAPLDDNTTWLSWNLHNTKLVLLVRSIYTAFYEKYAEFSHGDDSQADTDAYAAFLLIHMHALEPWVRDVPDALKIQRKDNSTPFSVDRSLLDVEQFAPLWVQRQRLFLELLYHYLCANLYRPFILFNSGSSTPLSSSSLQSPSPAETCANNCASHAMALTHFMRQIMSTTDILVGWQEAFQWQWSCAMTLVGFVLAFPHGELAKPARESINASIEILGIFGNSFAIAASAATVVRVLSETVDHIIVPQPALQLQGVDQELGFVPHADPSAGEVPQDEQAPAMIGQADAGHTEFSEEVAIAMQDILSESMDMAFAVDGYNDMNTLWPSPVPIPRHLGSYYL
ncbi:fungal-specific transcription factor domain-containing protein [Hypoxylon sp. NC1633]|nr:fungal-specific transcription factor domain-containing protein [Hypoxylon sp. NC1633]